MSVPELEGIAGSRPNDNANPKSISINDVVRRVKCEIRDSVADRVGKRDYPWFDKWTIQADLTLLVNQQSGISPGITLSHAFPLGNIPGRITNAPRSVSLGLGGGISTTAVRTEIVSFSMSIKEIRDEFKTMSAAEIYDECHPISSIDLTSDLGLKEWVDSALGPVDDGLLKEGYHKPPKPPGSGAGVGGGAATPQALLPGLHYSSTLHDLSKLLTEDDPLKGKIELIASEYDLLKQSGGLLVFLQSAKSFDHNSFTKALANLKSLSSVGPPDLSTEIPDLIAQISRTSDNINGIATKGQLAALNLLVKKLVLIVEKRLAKDLPPVIAALQLICDCEPPTEDGPLPDSDNDTSQRAGSGEKPSETFANGLKCLKTLQNVVQVDIPGAPKPKDPPIDAISHQVQFVLVLNASANPTWTLLQFKGPSPTSGSFASISQTTTHTLTIVMGEPNSAAVANDRASLTLSSALANQLIPSLQQGAPQPFIP